HRPLLPAAGFPWNSLWRALVLPQLGIESDRGLGVPSFGRGVFLPHSASDSSKKFCSRLYIKWPAVQFEVHIGAIGQMHDKISIQQGIVVDLVAFALSLILWHEHNLDTRRIHDAHDLVVGHGSSGSRLFRSLVAAWRS